MPMFTTVQPVSKPETTTKSSANYDAMASILAAVMLTMYAGSKSKKQLRKIKRHAAFLLRY